MDDPQESRASSMQFEFSGAIWHWRGPAPFHFITIPEEQSREIKEIAPLVTYGWGMIPVQAQIGGVSFTTALFHKEGLYVLPVKDQVRKAEGIGEGDLVAVRLEVQIPD